MSESILQLRRYLYLKLGLALSGISIAAYALQRTERPSGSSWLGYTLGLLGAAMIVWLMGFGVRKRSHTSDRTTVREWLSAHVYLGTSLMVVVTLHAAFQFGGNVHTLAWVLTLLVVATGAVGLAAYVRIPARMSENLAGQTLEGLMRSIADLDARARDLARPLPADYSDPVIRCSRETHIGGSIRRQLSGRDPDCATTRCLEQLKQRLPAAPREIGPALSELIGLLTRKRALLERAHTDVRLRAVLRLWLFAHVPLAFALLLALLAHVVSVFFFA